jgi:pyruvate formate-lyase/glycerol dehydratase family glycyl radical enzyme
MAISSLKRQTMDAEAVKKLNVLTERVQKRKREWVIAPPIITVESSISFTKSWKETEGLPVDLRWAKAFARRMQDSLPVIRDGELIVGSLTKHVRGVDIIAAFKPLQILRQLGEKQFDRKMSDTSWAVIEERDEKSLKEDVQYWADHMPPDYINTALREELGEGHFDLLMDRAMVIEGAHQRTEPERGLFEDYCGILLGSPDAHDHVIDKGLKAIIIQARAEQEKMAKAGAGLPAISSAGYHKQILLESIILSCKAVMDWANRHAELARSLARTESNPVRKKELEKIAEHCEWVPANPPRSFWEAVQSFYFIWLALKKEQPERLIMVGRLDQMLYPYYEKDLREGKVTPQQAAELLGCLWLKLREPEVMQTLRKDMRVAPAAQLPNVTIGGQDKMGRDVTNELSWIILEVMHQMKLSEPPVYIRYHKGMSDEFLLYALECNRDFQGGNPAFVNDELGTARYLARGIKLDDAVDWYASGCMGCNLDCDEHATGGMHLNQAKILELTLYNGFDPRIGKQLGPQTGDATKFTSIEQFYEAFFKQEDYYADQMRKNYFIRRSLSMANSAVSSLAAAMLYEDCIPKGLGPLEGGNRYPVNGIEWIGDRGITDVADCLASIKYLVFDKKKLTMAELMDALKANWEGKEEVRQACLKAPKYGNDNDYVDDIFNYVSLKTQEIMQSRPDPFTGLKPFLYKGAAAGHIAHGKVVGALPNGRKAGTPVNDGGTSAMPGMDVNGPTALINSATKAPHAWEEIGIVHNMKFSKTLMNTPEKLEKVLVLLKTFFARGGWHIQFNIHSADELIDARKHPEKWGHLIVRVAGYSAYFVDLPLSLQDEIIARTLHEV